MNDPEMPTEPGSNVASSSPKESTSKDPAIFRHERTIGEYQLIRRIGGGGMGVVYEALHTRLKRRVAVKVISESYLMRDGASRRFFREMEAAGRLNHPHIVQATDAGVAEGVPYLVMELIQGSNLAQLVRQYGALPPLAVLEAIDQAAKALGHIHAHGMVHRDIKPSNLLLNDQGQVKVADLGLAHLLEPMSENDEVTLSGDVVGTVDYMAPEQANNAKVIDPRSDIYSLGCCMHFLFCGATVFRAESHIDRLIAHRNEAVPELLACCGIPLPKSINRLFQEMLAKNPERRPQSAGEIVTRLAQCREELLDSLSRTSKKEARLIGSKSLPLDSGLQHTARSLLADGTPSDDSVFYQTTLLLKPRPLKLWYRYGAIAVLAILALLGVFYGKSFLAHVTNAKEAASKPIVLNAHPNAAVFNVHFSEDGQRVLSCASDGTVRVWDLPSKSRVSEMKHERGPDGMEVIDVALIPNTPLAVSVCYNGLATVWNWQTGEKKLEFDEHQQQVEGIAWIRGTHVMTTGRDDVVCIWDVNSGTVLVRMSNSHTGGVRCVAVDPEGRRAITADYSGNIMQWNVEEGKEQFVDWHQPLSEAIQLWCIDWIPGSNRVALGGAFVTGEPLLIVYDVNERRIVRQFTKLTGRVYGVRASPDGHRLYSAADDVHGWSLDDVKDGDPTDPLEPLFKFSEHSDNVWSIDESPDGEQLATGGTDGTVRVIRWRELLKK